jgi:hypothetical protein
MKPRWVALGTIALLGLLLLFVQILKRSADAADAAVNFETWAPSAAAIRVKVGPGDPAHPESSAEKTRRTTFAKLFANRYREHDPAMAIGLRFLDNKRIKLMCPARMEPWNVDRLAMVAWRESRDAMGHPFDIDIYETYIGTPPVKIGELRPSPKEPHIMLITYRYSGATFPQHQSPRSLEEPETLPMSAHQ